MASSGTKFRARPDYWLWILKEYHRKKYPEGYTPYAFVADPFADPHPSLVEFYNNAGTCYIVAPLGCIGALSKLGGRLKAVTLHDVDIDCVNDGRMFVAECASPENVAYMVHEIEDPSEIVVCLPDAVSEEAARGTHLKTLSSQIENACRIISVIIDNATDGHYADVADYITDLLLDTNAIGKGGKKEAAAELAAALTRWKP